MTASRHLELAVSVTELTVFLCVLSLDHSQKMVPLLANRLDTFFPHSSHPAPRQVLSVSHPEYFSDFPFLSAFIPTPLGYGDLSQDRFQMNSVYPFLFSPYSLYCNYIVLFRMLVHFALLLA